GRYTSDHEDDDEMDDMNNLDTTIQVSPNTTTRIHKDHPLDQVIEDLHSTTQTRYMSKNLEEHRKKAIGTKWVFQNKKDERGIVIRNKARLVAQGHTQEEGIDYDEVFAPVVRIKAIRLFLAYASFKDFMVYQMDVKSAFLYEKIEEEMMHEKFQMSSMGELTFFLGLQVKQKQDGIFISQDKYVAEILKKYEFTKVKNASTPIETKKPLLKDEDGKEVDVHMYRLMICSLMYLTSSRPDIMFAVYACARYQVNPKVSHLHVVKRIFRDLQLEDDECVDCLPNAAIFEHLTLMGYEKISQKLTFYKAFFFPQWKFFIHTILQCLSSKTTAWNEFSSTMASAIICLAINQKFNFSKYIFESMVKNLDNVNKFFMYLRFVQVFLDKQLEGMSTHNRIYVTPSHTKKIFGIMRMMRLSMRRWMDDSLERDATTTSSLEAEQDSGNINKTQSKATLNEASSIGTSSGSSPRCQETMGDTITQTRVLDLENTKTTQALKIDSLKRRVKKLEKKQRSKTHKLKRLYKVGLIARVNSSGEASLGEDASKQRRIIDDIDADEGITLVDETAANREEVPLKEVNAAVAITTTATIDDITLAKDLMEIKSEKPKGDKVVIQEPEQGTTTTTLTTTTAATTITTASTRPKAKGLIIHEQEQTPTPIVSSQQPKSQDKAKRAVEKRNRPPTRAQQRSIMCTYLKNTEGWKPKSLKNKSFANIQELFNKAMKMVNTFVDYRTESVVESSKEAKAEVTKGSSKRVGEELEQENAKNRRWRMIKNLQSLNNVWKSF
nr:hypothetical protein [Tanacetum cinerariifolium]